MAAWRALGSGIMMRFGIVGTGSGRQGAATHAGSIDSQTVKATRTSGERGNTTWEKKI